MTGLFLIARIADETVAIPTMEIGSVVEVDQITAVPRVASHVAGLFALRSRVLTVIDSRAALGQGMIARADVMTGVIVNCDGHSYALLVEEVEDVIEAVAAQTCPSVLAREWQRAALGSIRHGERALLVVDPAVLVTGVVPLAA